MAVTISFVPTSQEQSHYEQTVTLSGTQYLLRFDWVQRWGRWTLSLFSTSGAELLLGSPLLVGADVFAHVKHDDRLPPGSLVVLDKQKKGGEPSLSDFHFDGDYVLVYVEQLDD